MATQAGHLLISRMHIWLPPGVSIIDTGLRQLNHAFSPDPPLGGSDIPPVASRVMVIPLVPLAPWVDAATGLDLITHNEPYLGTGGVVEVAFNNLGDLAEINVLFWDPHTGICPLDADAYGTGCFRCGFVSIQSTFSDQS